MIHVLVLVGGVFMVGLASSTNLDLVHIQGESRRVFPGLPVPPPFPSDQPCLRAVLSSIDIIDELVPAICTEKPLG